MRPNAKKRFGWALLVFLGLWTTGLTQSIQYPQMPNTGNPAADQAAYEQAKLQFMQQHPELFPKPATAAQPHGDLERQNSEYEAAKTQASIQVDQARLAIKAQNEYRQLLQEFNENKGVWYNSDPARYNAYLQALQLAPINPLVNYIPYSEYITYPAEKRAVIDANPSLYVIVNNQ